MIPPPQTTVATVDIETFLRQNQEKELLRFTTAGSVDDGKSTLIGRLLYDSKGVYEDQLASVKRASVGQTGPVVDFALLTDGLRAEREQGITIDVAYRYFSTPKRKFIIADTPGHEQYTRNMATGASSANLAVILVDARNGVLPQSRRHAFISALLGIQHIVVAVNKMDLVDFREDVFERISKEFASFTAPFQVRDIHFIPISALWGDNVVDKSSRMPWFEGEPLLKYLETVHIASDRNFTELRFPVQHVLRPHQNFRGFAGQVASGIVHTGDPVMVLPSGKLSRVKSILTYDGALQTAFPPMSITVCLEDEIDISRGDMLVPPSHAPHVSRLIDVRTVWMSAKPLVPGAPFLVKHTTQTVRAKVVAVRYKINVDTLEKNVSSSLELNEIGAVVLETYRPLFFDPYRRNPATGSLILIDPSTNETAGAGMITGRRPQEVSLGNTILEGLQYDRNSVSTAQRESRMGHKPATVWLAGSVELAHRLEEVLFERGCLVHTLIEERESSVLAEIANITNAAGLITVCCFSLSDSQERVRARTVSSADRFVEIDATQLPPNIEDAAAQICNILQQRQLIPSKGI